MSIQFYGIESHASPLLVGEPKLRIMQKHKIFAPERYTAEFLYMECVNIG